MSCYKNWIVLAIITILATTSACEKNCSGEGTLVLTNESSISKKITINSISYGTLSPGEKEEYDLPAGSYVVEWYGIGGPGCNPFNVNIVECNRQAYKCTY